MRTTKFVRACAELVRCHRMWLIHTRRERARLGCRDFSIVVTSRGVKDYHELRDRFDTNQQLVIGSNDCEHSPYGVHGNLTIRAAHDLGHVHYGMDFSMDGEFALSARMQAELLGFCNPKLRREVAALYWVDTIGFQTYHATHGCFPPDQTKFIRAALRSMDL